MMSGTFDRNSPDTRMRLAAFDHVRQLMGVRDWLTWSELSAGFVYGDKQVHLLNKPRGIFKPRQMQYLLSIKTVVPRSGRSIWYEDQRQVHRQIYEGEDTVDYAFMGSNPDATDNRLLRDAYQNQIPVIYFLGVAPAIYQPMIPTFISGWDPIALRARITFAMPDRTDMTGPPNTEERRYALRSVKLRLHQGSFREAVIAAYRGRCALSGLAEHRLLDAAHIVSDANELLSQPIVSNGLSLSKIHHAAFDSHLIGIDPDYRVHVSERLLAQHDGPMLEALKRLHGENMHLPGRRTDYPDRNRLASRFAEFTAAA